VAKYSLSLPESIFTRDMALNRPTLIDFGNSRLTFAYTGFGAFKGSLSSEAFQPISSILDPNDTARTVSYGYQNELKASETRPDQTVYYAYDVLGRLLGVTNSTGPFAYGYSDVGNLPQSLQYPGATGSRNYDGMGAVTNITIWLNEGQNSVAYDYDSNGNRLHVYRAKSLAYNGVDSTVNYGYDPAGQLTSAVGREIDNTARLNEQFGYGYDQAGNLLTRTNGVLVQAFVSDPANELTNITRNTSLTFDGNGSTNLSSVTVNGQSTAIYRDQTFATTSGLALANGSDAFTVVAIDTLGNGLTNRFSAVLPLAQRLTYDLNGNLTSDGTRGFDYDDWNELVRVTTTNVWKTEYAYDGLRRHHARLEYAWQNGGWLLVNTCYYVYAGHHVVQEVNTAGPTVSYTYGLELLERDSTATNQPPLFYQTDGNGSVTLLFDLNQQVQARYLYDPYGNLLAKSGAMADANRYRFSGKEFDPRTGLYYFGYRFYEPNFQRWLNQDPIGERGGLNLYAYVGNNPVNYIDPLGLTFLVSPTPFPGQEGTYGPYVLNIPDGSSLVKTPHKLDPNDLFKNELKTCKELHDKSSWLALWPRDEANFDTDYFRGLDADYREYYWYNRKIYADNEINYFGIGMYENWAGDPLFVAKGITYAWKLSQYGLTPNENTIYWLNKGYNDYSAFTDPSKPLPKNK